MKKEFLGKFLGEEVVRIIGETVFTSVFLGKDDDIETPAVCSLEEWHRENYPSPCTISLYGYFKTIVEEVAKEEYEEENNKTALLKKTKRRLSEELGVAEEVIKKAFKKGTERGFRENTFEGTVEEVTEMLIREMREREKRLNRNKEIYNLLVEHELPTRLSACIGNQYGEFVEEEGIEILPNGIIKSFYLNCYSSEGLGLGTCQCWTHDPYESYEYDTVLEAEEYAKMLEKAVKTGFISWEEFKEIYESLKRAAERDKFFKEVLRVIL